MKFTAFNDHIALDEKSYDEIPEPWTVDAVSHGDFEIDDLFGEAPSTYSTYTGNVSIAGNAVLCQADEYQLIVIDGDVAVDGVAAFSVWDSYRPVIITGSLSAKSLVLSAETHLYVLGDLAIEELFAADLGDGGYASFAGKATAARFVCGANGEVAFESNPDCETGVSLADLGGDFPELAPVFEAMANQTFDIE